MSSISLPANQRRLSLQRGIRNVGKILILIAAVQRESLAAQAMRTLAVAYRELPAGSVNVNNVRNDLEHNLVFAGLIGMIDPPRDEARGAVERSRSAASGL